MTFFLFFVFLSSSLSLTLDFKKYWPLIIFLFIIVILVLRFWKKERKTIVFALALGLVTGLLVNKNCPQKGTELQGIVIKAEENYFLVRTVKGVFVIFKRGSEAELFDIVRFQGSYTKPEFPHYQGSFDFQDYLVSYGCYYQCKIKDISFLFKSPLKILHLRKRLLSSYTTQSRILISSLVFGTGLSSLDNFKTLSESGILNLFSLSGIHLSFLMQVISDFFNQHQKKETGEVISLFLLIPFLFFDSFSSSILRLFFLRLLNLLLKRKKIRTSYFSRLSLAGILVLVINPSYVLSLGFLYTYPPLFLLALFRFSFPKRKKKSRLLFSLSLVLLYYSFNLILNHGFNLLSFPLLYLLAPLSSLLFLLELSVFLGLISVPFLELLNTGLVKVLSVKWVRHLFIAGGHLNWVYLLLFYITLVLVLFLHELPLGKKTLKGGIILLLALTIFPLFPDLSSHYEVHFIDVGQGDSTLVRAGRKNILIDTGGLMDVDLATSALIPYFHQLKIYKLDLVLTTHEDYDHVGALDSLVENFTVAKVVRGGEKQRTEVGDFLITDLNVYRENNMSNNDTSAVYSFVIKNTSFLIMGDAPSSIEKKIIKDHPDLRCDVLKVGHHGSDTSSSYDFLQSVKPKKAVISCGLNNKYHHPSKKTIKNLNDLQIDYVRTDLSGTYVYKV